MGDWVSCPDNNPWTMPDGTQLRAAVEAVRNTLEVPADPWAPWMPQGYQDAYVSFDLRHAVWEYWSEEASEGPSEFVAGFEAAAAETRWQIRRVRLLGWLRVFAFLGIGLGVTSLVASWLGPITLVGSALLSSAAAVVAMVLSSRITRMDREARRG